MMTCRVACSAEPSEPSVSASTQDAPPCSSPYGWVLRATGIVPTTRSADASVIWIPILATRVSEALCSKIWTVCCSWSWSTGPPPSSPAAPARCIRQPRVPGWLPRIRPPPAGHDRARDRLLLLDGHSLAYRAFFALPPENFSTTTGQPTNAVYGFTAMLINVLRDEQPTHVAVAFDRSEPTFRHEQFVEYKANRRETPTDFRGQLSLIFEVLDALGIQRLSLAGYEADDIIATLATQAAEHDMGVLIVTGDRDALQLVNGDITVLMTRRGISDMTRFTPAEVIEKYGLTPPSTPTSPRCAATRATTCRASRAWARRPRPSGSSSSARWLSSSTRSTR